MEKKYEDIILENLISEKFKVQKCESKVERTSFLYCLESGIEFSSSAYDDAKSELVFRKGQYIDWLEIIFKRYCEIKKIDINELEMYCKERI